MRARQLIIIVLGLTVAAAAALSVGALLQSRSTVVTDATAPAPTAALQEVLVASVALEPGSFIRIEHLSWQPWPTGANIQFYFAHGSITPEDLAGALVRRPFSAGEPITRTDVLRAGESGFLAAVLKPGLRAVSIKVDAASSSAGLIVPGDLVDVILTNRLPATDNASGATRLVSQTMLVGSRVLALDQQLSEHKPDPNEPATRASGQHNGVPETVTLEVDEKNAERLAVAARLGDLILSLHSFARTASDAASDAASGTADSSAATRKISSVTFDTEVSPSLRAATAPAQGPVGPTIIRGSATTEVAK